MEETFKTCNEIKLHSNPKEVLGRGDPDANSSWSRIVSNIFIYLYNNDTLACSMSTKINKIPSEANIIEIGPVFYSYFADVQISINRRSFQF